MDPAARLATLDTVALTLTKVEFDLLFAQVEATGRVLSREQLVLSAADRDFEAFDRSIDVHVSSLRKKLGDDSPGRLSTDWGRCRWRFGAAYAVFHPGPLAFAHDRQSGAVDDQMQALPRLEPPPPPSLDTPESLVSLENERFSCP